MLTLVLNLEMCPEVESRDFLLYWFHLYRSRRSLNVVCRVVDCEWGHVCFGLAREEECSAMPQNRSSVAPGARLEATTRGGK